jgi:predicted ester cyclase
MLTETAISPTGRRITLTGIHVMRVEGGKVVEHWGQQDSLGLMQQLGAIPAAARG